MEAVIPPVSQGEPRQLAERCEDERPEDRPEERPRAAHDGPDDDLDREGDAEHAVRLEREEIEGIERPPDPGQERGDDHREHLVLERVDAERLARALVLADRAEVDPEASPLEERDHARGEQHEGQRDVVVGPRVLELELARIARERDVEPDRAAEGVDVRHRSEEHTSELQSRLHLVCRLLLEKKKKKEKAKSSNLYAILVHTDDDFAPSLLLV